MLCRYYAEAVELYRQAKKRSHIVVGATQWLKKATSNLMLLMMHVLIVAQQA